MLLRVNNILAITRQPQDKVNLTPHKRNSCSIEAGLNFFPR